VLRRLTLLITVLSLSPVLVQAGRITYTMTTDAAGTLGGTRFNGPITVMLTGDTSGIFTLSSNPYFTYANPGTTTLFIPGLGAATFTDQLYAVSSGNMTFNGEAGVYAVGINDPNISSLVLVAGDPGYNLATSITYSGTGGLGNGGGTGNIFPTTAGNLQFVRQQPPIAGPATITAVLTQSESGPGGTTSAPASFTGTTPIGSISGTISGLGAQDYYSFYWGGGPFVASAAISSASALSTYLFSAGSIGSCDSIGSSNLSTSNNWTSIISSSNLAAGQYCIGLTATSSYDPPFTLTFDTPVSATPEPNGMVLVGAGLALAAIGRAVARRARAGRSNPRIPGAAGVWSGRPGPATIFGKLQSHFSNV